MVTIFIKDTGIIKPGEEGGTQESNIVNGGNELPLKGVSITFARGLRFDNKPSPGVYGKFPVRLNFVSVVNPIITLAGEIRDDGDLSSATNVINKISDVTSITDQDGSSSTDEIDILYLLDQLCVTKGYKELFYKDSSANNNLLYGIGSTDTFNSEFRHLHVLCKGIRITQNGTSGLINWVLTCEITKGE